MAESWKKEFARDMRAMGSLPFYVIVFIRTLIGNYPPIIYQLIIAFFVLGLSAMVLKPVDKYVGRGLILFVFISLFYKEPMFTVFTAFLWVGLLISQQYLKVKVEEILKGAICGGISVGISAYITSVWIL